MNERTEQRVLDAIDELVEWQIEEGYRRGDGPARERASLPLTAALECYEPGMYRLGDLDADAVARHFGWPITCGPRPRRVRVREDC